MQAALGPGFEAPAGRCPGRCGPAVSGTSAGLFCARGGQAVLESPPHAEATPRGDVAPEERAAAGRSQALRGAGGGGPVRSARGLRGGRWEPRPRMRRPQPRAAGSGTRFRAREGLGRSARPGVSRERARRPSPRRGSRSEPARGRAAAEGHGGTAGAAPGSLGAPSGGAPRGRRREARFAAKKGGERDSFAGGGSGGGRCGAPGRSPAGFRQAKTLSRTRGDPAVLAGDAHPCPAAAPVHGSVRSRGAAG